MCVLNSYNFVSVINSIDTVSVLPAQKRLIVMSLFELLNFTGGYMLKRKCITSPSFTRYSLPSKRHLPASLAPDSPLNSIKSS